MKYRQWKKNYKKRHGVNPPLALDKRRYTKKVIKNINRVDFAGVVTRLTESVINASANFMRDLGGCFDAAGTVCRNTANVIQPLKIKERVLSWEAKEYRNYYGVYEVIVPGKGLRKISNLKLLVHSKCAAEKIVEIMENDQLWHVKATDPIRIQHRDDKVDNMVYDMRFITREEEGSEKFYRDNSERGNCRHKERYRRSSEQNCGQDNG